MQTYEVCLAWDWQYDAHFTKRFEAECQCLGLPLFQVTPHNLPEVLARLDSQRIRFRGFFDRASDTDSRFLPLVQWASLHSVVQINDHELARRARDKVCMHKAISALMHTPATVILPSYEEQPDLSEIDLGCFGTNFIIKPACGGGGEGVIIGATSLVQARLARRENPSQKYLLQSYVAPARLDSRAAWFRVIFCLGQIYPFWWDVDTHVYTPVAESEREDFGLSPLWSLTHSIANICGLDLFSTEITLTLEGKFIVVDYVNDPIDLRPQSKTPDGVPDDVVEQIVRRLAEFLSVTLSNSGRRAFDSRELHFPE